MAEHGTASGGGSQSHYVLILPQPFQNLTGPRLYGQSVLFHIFLKPLGRLLPEPGIVKIFPISLQHNLPAVIGIQPDAFGKDFLHSGHAVFFRYGHPGLHTYNLCVKQDPIHIKYNRFHFPIPFSVRFSIPHRQNLPENEYNYRAQARPCPLPVCIFS